MSETVKQLPNLTLVLGVDGAGKSTFLNNLAAEYGHVVVEPTASPEAKAFKVASVDVPIDEELIAQREALFLAQNDRMDREFLETPGNLPIATTGSRLITIASHALMRTVAGQSQYLDVANILESWRESALVQPSGIVMVQAPDAVIQKRIKARQRRGDRLERFWGFNSPHFLLHYQRTMRQLVRSIARDGDIDCLELDSGTSQPAQMMQIYSAHIA